MIRGWMFGPLRDAASEGGEGGGGNSGGNSGNNGGQAFDMNAFFSRFEQTLDAKLGAIVPKPAGKEGTEGKEGKEGTKEGEGNSPRWKQLQEELAAEKKARLDSEKKAEEKERHGLIRGLLSDFTFSNDRAREDAFKAFSTEITRGENDGLLGPENEAAKEYIKRCLEGDRAYWLKTKDVGGSGAVNGGSRGGSQPVDLNNIKPGMDATELQRVRAEIARVALNAMRGQS